MIARRIETYSAQDMVHSSSSSFKTCVEGGYNVIYNETEWQVLYKGKLVLLGGHTKGIGLWLIPIAERSINLREKNCVHGV